MVSYGPSLLSSLLLACTLGGSREASEKPTACMVPLVVYEFSVSGFAVSGLLVIMHGAAGSRTSPTCTMLKSRL